METIGAGAEETIGATTIGLADAFGADGAGSTGTGGDEQPDVVAVAMNKTNHVMSRRKSILKR